MLLNFIEILKNYLPEITTFLQPTSPIRRLEDLIGSVKTLDNPYFNSCVSVHKNHDFVWEQTKDKKVIFLLMEKIDLGDKNTQSL